MKTAFLFGITFCLILFGLIFPLFPNIKITYSSSNTLLDWMGTFLTILAVSVAVWGRTIKGWFYRPKVEIVGFLSNEQENKQLTLEGITRLLFVNNGRDEAKSVEVYVDKIEDVGGIRADFVPVPLVWTHSGLSKRSLLSGQYAYLDLCSRELIAEGITTSDEMSIPKLMLNAGRGIPTYQDLCCNTTLLTLSVFVKSEKTKKYKIKLACNNEPTVKVTDIHLL